MTMPHIANSMTLKALLGNIKGYPPIPELAIAGLKLDSRKVEPGDVFVALAGTQNHGMRFVNQSLAKGAAAVLYDPIAGGQKLADDLGCEISKVLIAIEQLDQKLGLIADHYYGTPSAKMTVIGITGTDGKTSCSFFVSQALGIEQPCAVIGTLGWGFSDSLQPTQHTTPHAIDLQQRLDSLCRMGAQAVAMEVSSHGLVQGRTNGVRFTGALFTNIGRDHLDYHASADAYLEAKLRILDAPGLEFVVVNLDDGSSEKIINRVPENAEIFGFSRKPGREVTGSRMINRIAASEIIHSKTGLSFLAESGNSKVFVEIPVFGHFNVDNALATMACLISLGYSLQHSAELMDHVRAVPGRLERFENRSGDPTVVVDYAHTPQALENALGSLKHHCEGNLWLVFGCGGDRDRGKRPQMGNIAENLADEVIVTDDNPRTENGDRIVDEILEGFRQKNVRVIRNRKSAIYSAINQARADDVVLISGKGHETTQEINGVKHPFSDRQIVGEALLHRSLGH